MTIDQAIAEVERRAAGRTRYDGCSDRLDEVLVAEIKRLRARDEALTVAAKALQLSVNSHILHRQQALEALAACHAAGIETGEGKP